VVALAAVAALATASCGIATDGGPRDIPPDQRLLEETTSGEAQAGDRARVYLINVDGRLEPRGRDVAELASTVIDELLKGPSEEERAQGLRTEIPPGTTRLQSSVNDGVLSLELSGELLTVTSPELMADAMAQLVFTATALDGVNQVLLAVEGGPAEWPRGDGSFTSSPLTVFDFPERDLTSQPDYPALASPVPSTTQAPGASTTTTTPLSRRTRSRRRRTALRPPSGSRRGRW
jgi:spore germination protein GerM